MYLLTYLLTSWTLHLLHALPASHRKNRHPAIHTAAVSIMAIKGQSFGGTWWARTYNRSLGQSPSEVQGQSTWLGAKPPQAQRLLHYHNLRSQQICLKMFFAEQNISSYVLGVWSPWIHQCVSINSDPTILGVLVYMCNCINYVKSSGRTVS